MRRYKLEVRGREFSIDVQELAADDFEVVVDGETYEVSLASDEDLPVANIHPAFAPSAAAPAKAAPVVSVRPRAVPAAGARKSGSGSAALNAPMPGVIIAVCVEAGDTVTRGQEIAVLDAMKMHNSIKSPRAGKIREVCVTQGHAVGHGDPIVRFEEG